MNQTCDLHREDMSFLQRLAGKRHLTAATFAVPFLILWLLVLCFYGYLGHYTRYYADDFTNAYGVMHYGYLGWQKEVFMNLDGKFAAAAVLPLFRMTDRVLNNGSNPFWICFMLAVWILAANAALRSLLRLIFKPVGMFGAAALAALLVFATIEIVPNLFQSLYWSVARCVYVTPIVLLLLNTILVCKAINSVSNKPYLILLVCLVGFLNSGFSELVGPLQAGLVTLTILGTYLFTSTPLNRSVLKILAFWLLGAILGFLLIYFSPGSVGRRSGAFGPDSLWFVFLFGLEDTWRFLSGTVIRLPLLFTVSSLFSALMGLIAHLNDETILRLCRRLRFRRHCRR